MENVAARTPQQSTHDLVLRVMVFGQLTDHIGASHIEISEVRDTDTLRTKLQERFPALLGMKYSIALNKKITHQNVAISAGDELALMPPFSGG